MGKEITFQKLLEEKIVRETRNCKDNVVMLGDSLLYSFGLNMRNPTDAPDMQKGYDRAKEFLRTVCTAFKDPTHVVRVAPFAHAYLGSADFENALDIIVKRAEKNSKEQFMLDEVLSATTLVKPELRQRFLESVRSAGDISDEMFGLGMLINSIDPSADFSTPDEFPAGFRTYDVAKAASMIGAFIDLGIFVPAKGFTKEYAALLKSMGSFDYMLLEPSSNDALVVSKRKWPFDNAALNIRTEMTTDINARPENSGKYPSIVMINEADVTPAEARRLYRRATVMYVAADQRQRKAMEELLGDKKDLIVYSGDELDRTLAAHIRLIRATREKDVIDLDDALKSRLEEARDLARSGNEHFYDLRDEFDKMGRLEMVTEMVEREKIKMPKKTDYKLVILLSDKEKDLMTYFEGATDKKLRHFSKLPKPDETGMPFVIITNQPITEKAVRDVYPFTPVLYFARNSHEARAIEDANGAETFVVNAETVEKGLRGKEIFFHGAPNIGYDVVNMFFDRIAERRGKGVTTMDGVTKAIAAEIKKIRDQIVFGRDLNHYYDTARRYWNIQQKYSGAPLVAQLLDGVLMQTCPTGGCHRMTREPYGGCGANYTEVMVNFAVAFRKQVGDEKFVEELKKFHGGKVVAPWYVGHWYYRDRGFDTRWLKEGQREEPVKKRMRF